MFLDATSQGLSDSMIKRVPSAARLNRACFLRDLDI